MMELIGQLALAALIGYIMGSIPSALIIGKVFYHVDIREHGSHNLGGTNAGRVLGKKAGVSVMAFDILKVALALLLSLFLFGKESNLFVLLTGTGAVLGHCYPLFAGFRGGKAVSTVSALVFMTNWVLTIVAIITFFTTLKLTKKVSLSSILSALIVIVLSFIPVLIIPGMWNISYDLNYAIIISSVSLFLIYRHHENIKRLIAGTERKITWM